MAASFFRFMDHTQLHTPLLVGLLWASDQPVAETSTWQTHNTHNRETSMLPTGLPSDLHFPTFQQHSQPTGTTPVLVYLNSSTCTNLIPDVRKSSTSSVEEYCRTLRQVVVMFVFRHDRSGLINSCTPVCKSVISVLSPTDWLTNWLTDWLTD
jgi:hypothetical protein